MASALPSFPSTKETTNYARLCRLLVDVGKQALRDTFDSIHSPAGLHHVLARNPEHATLQSLRKRKILNPTQWGNLYPTIPSYVSSAGFDITLLMILLRNICGLHPPATGWDNLPPPADTSKEDNIARVKYYRNIVYGHASQASVDDSTFYTYWQDISTALVALGGTSYGAAISKLKNECMDPDMEEHYRELLKQWKADEHSLKDAIVKTEDNIRCHIEKMMENFMAQLERILNDKDNIGSHIEKMMDDLMAQLERAILKDKDENRSHIEKMMDNFMAQLERASSKDKDRLHSTFLWPYQNSSGRKSDNIRSHIEKMMENFMGKLKSTISGDKVSCFVVLIPLCEHRGNGDHKRSLKQQPWNRTRKKHFKKRRIRMGHNILEETIRLQRMFDDMPEFEKQQAREDFEEFKRKAKRMIFNVQVTIKSLRKAADKLDEVWKDCKIAHACGATAGIVVGIFTIGGGVAAFMAAAIAAPLLVAGMGVGAAGAGTHVGISIMEAFVNSKEIKKAEEDLKEAFDCINNVKKNVQLWLDRKEEASLWFIFCLAIQTLELSVPVIKLLQQVLLDATNLSAAIVEAAKRVFLEVGQRREQAAGQAGAQAAGKAGTKAAGKAAGKAVGKPGTKAAGQAAGKAGTKAAGKAGTKAGGQAGAQTAGQAGAQTAGRAGVQAAGGVEESDTKTGAKAVSKLAGGLITGVSIPFLVWDAIDLGFTIRDIVENKGSEAARFLREKADELEKVC